MRNLQKFDFESFDGVNCCSCLVQHDIYKSIEYKSYVDRIERDTTEKEQQHNDFIKNMQNMGFALISQRFIYHPSWIGCDRDDNDLLEKVYESSNQKAEANELFYDCNMHLCFFKHKNAEGVKILSKISKLSVKACVSDISPYKSYYLPEGIKIIVHSTENDGLVVKREIDNFFL